MSTVAENYQDTPTITENYRGAPTLTDKYRNADALIAVNILYIVFVELVILANIVLWLRCLNQWRRLRDHVMLLACLGVGDIYLMAASIWTNIPRAFNGGTLTVCDTWRMQHDDWLTYLPMVDMAGVFVMIVSVLYNRRSLTPSDVSSMAVLSVPWTLSLAVALPLSLGMGIDMCICENFTYDRYMGFNASKLVYILTVVVPMLSGVLVCVITKYSRRKSRQYQHSMQYEFEKKPFTELKQGDSKNSNNVKTYVYNEQRITSNNVITTDEYASKSDPQIVYKCTDHDKLCGNQHLLPGVTNSETKNPSMLFYSIENQRTYCDQHPSHTHGYITYSWFWSRVRLTAAAWAQRVFSQRSQMPRLSQIDTQKCVSFRVAALMMIYLCLVVNIPMAILNISTFYPQFQTTFNRHTVDMFKLVNDIYLWVYYLRTSITPTIWILYIHVY